MKASTASMQATIVDLGNRLGFQAEAEVCLEKENIGYSPIHDVVWWLDISGQFDTNVLNPLFSSAPYWKQRIQRIPFAVFEIEGSTTSSKNQVGNAANLYACSGIFKFMIVNNAAAAAENDTYRRGIKIGRYFRNQWGDRNLVLCDWSHVLPTLIGSFDESSLMPKELGGKPCARSGFGGETISVPIADYISGLFCESGLHVEQNYVPDSIREEAESYAAMNQRLAAQDFESAVYYGQKYRNKPEDSLLNACKGARDCRYMPRLDLAAGLFAPVQFCQWIRRLGIAMKEDAVLYPMVYLQKRSLHHRFVSLFAVEVETGASKHANGGILNLSNQSYCGIWAAPSEAKGHLLFMQNRFGLNNVVHFPIDSWLGRPYN